MNSMPCMATDHHRRFGRALRVRPWTAGTAGPVEVQRHGMTRGDDL